MKRISKKEIEELLSSRLANQKYKRLNDLPNPFLFLNMQKAANRIHRAIKNRELITVIGDYDVDGVVATAILIEFFEFVKAKYEYIIPNRFKDGYGISKNVLDRVKGSLIITVDNGISAIEGAKLCKEMGIDLIITDHHTPQEILPDAYAIINPKQQQCTFPIQEICGAQVAWYLVAALKSVMGVKYELKDSLDILTIAIIADLMPLVEINRSLVKHGLSAIEQSKRPAIKILRDALSKERILSEDIAFLIAPKLNSAGRMDDANVALRFLISQNQVDAQNLYSSLLFFNEQRKQEENAIFDKAYKSVSEDDEVIVLWDREWHEGVIGIVSARLVDNFKKPAIIISIKDNHAKGSARAPEGVNIFNLIATQKELLLSFGGHKNAAGLNLEVKNLERFKEGINRAYKQNMDILYKDGACKDSICNDVDSICEDVVGEISLNEIDLELLEILDRYEPYGEGNPKPIFLSQELAIKECRSVGGELKHTYFVFEELDTKTIKRAIAYKKQYELKESEIIRCDFFISKNEFNKIIEPRIIVRNLYR